MILTNERRIVEVFSKEPWKEKSFREIKREAKNKSDNYVHSTLKKLVKNNVIKERRAGNVILYSLKNSQEGISLAAYVEEYKTQKSKHLPLDNIRKIANAVPTSMFSLLITGSYAEKRQSKESDIDVVVLCCSSFKTRKVLASIKSKAELMIPEVHPYVFTEAEFKEMLVNKEENYGKEVARKNMLFCGGETYFRIMLSAIEDGFKG